MYIGPVRHHFHQSPQTNQGELGQEISAANYVDHNYQANDVGNADSSQPQNLD
jgi:hypothetical protein